MTIAVIVAIVLAIPAAIFAIECVLGSMSLRRHELESATVPPFAVLIPAHDEALNIAATVRHVLTELRAEDRLLVVADNCTDETADTARSAGAMVVERFDSEQRGKGFALDFGRDALTNDPPPVVIVIDADCRVSSGSLERLAAEAASRNVGVQAYYSMDPPSNADVVVSISCFAFLVRNLVRQRALVRLRGAPLLQGTGMAFPWSMFAAAPLATGAIVEDLAIGIALLGKDHRLAWTEAVRVSSLPAGKAATIIQRTRWEHGFLATSLGNVPRLIGDAFRQKRWDMMALALDLLVPPLALLVMVTALGWAMAAGLAFASGSWVPFTILSGALAVIWLGVLLAWAAEGRRSLPLVALVKVPLYLIWKLPIYVRLFGRRETSWIRTARK